MAKRVHTMGISTPIVVVGFGGKPQTPPDVMPKVGDRFESIAQAEFATGIARTHISAQLNGRVPHARGVLFADAVAS